MTSEKAPAAPTTRLEAANAFISAIKELREKDRGRFASLKRNAGDTLAEARNISWFYGLLNRFAHGRDEDIYFLVATLIGWNKHTMTGDFGRTMARLADAGNKESVERRCQILLDADFDSAYGQRAGGEIAFRLRQMVKLAASKEIGIDWAQLLLDLRDWNYESKSVQKRWAASFYAPQIETSETEAMPDALAAKLSD